MIGDDPVLSLAIEQRDAARAAVTDLRRQLAAVTAERDRLIPGAVAEAAAAGLPITLYGVPYIRARYGPTG